MGIVQLPDAAFFISFEGNLQIGDFPEITKQNKQPLAVSRRQWEPAAEQMGHGSLVVESQITRGDNLPQFLPAAVLVLLVGIHGTGSRQPGLDVGPLLGDRGDGGLDGRDGTGQGPGEHARVGSKTPGQLPIIEAVEHRVTQTKKMVVFGDLPPQGQILVADTGSAVQRFPHRDNPRQGHELSGKCVDQSPIRESPRLELGEQFLANLSE